MVEALAGLGDPSSWDADDRSYAAEARRKQRIVFFVGPDMCGKTNIAREVASRTGIPYFKASGEHSAYLSSRVDRAGEFLQQLRYADPRVFDLLRQAGYSLIFDRGFPCEAAYSSVMGRYTDDQMLAHMDKMWASIGAKIVFCYRSSYAGVVDDLDPSISELTLGRIHRAYEEFFVRSLCSVHRLNVDDGDLEREVDEVFGFMGYPAVSRLSMMQQAMGLYDDEPDTERDGGLEREAT